MDEEFKEPVKKDLDNHVWREKRALMDTFKFLWETVGPDFEWNELIDMIDSKRDELALTTSAFDSPKFRGSSEDGITRQYRYAMLAITKEQE